MYKITNYTKNKAKKLGLVVKPSIFTTKKIDVFRNNIKIGSVGAIAYKDYPTYLELENKKIFPKGTAANRRKLYKIRHDKDRKKINSNGWLADQLLW